MAAEPVRWGVLGCARIFERRIAPAFAAAANARLLAVASRDLEKAHKVAALSGAQKAFGSYDDLLGDPQIEAVYIPLPNDLHGLWTRRALAAGKHVLCDKPLTLTAAEARACAEDARAAGLRLMEAFMVRFHPQHAVVQQWVADGAIGVPTHLDAAFTYPAAVDPNNIRYQPERGGGALLDVGVYGVTAARWHFGAEPVAVSVVGVIDPATGVDTRALLTLEFSQGRTASIVCAFDLAFASRYELRGPSGSLIAERAFQVGEKGVSIVLQAHNAEPVVVASFPHLDQYAREIEHFGACVRDPSLPLAPGEDGVAQAVVVDALRRSLAEGRRVVTR
jgi:predicted dehydrogenase